MCNGGKKRFSKLSATAACYAIITMLATNFVDHFGTEAIDRLVERLNVFQTALVKGLEDYRYS